jgi:hypothetical protein
MSTSRRPIWAIVFPVQAFTNLSLDIAPREREARLR